MLEGVAGGVAFSAGGLTDLRLRLKAQIAANMTTVYNYDYLTKQSNIMRNEIRELSIN